MAAGRIAFFMVMTHRRAILLIEQVAPVDDDPEQQNWSRQKSPTAVYVVTVVDWKRLYKEWTNDIIEGGNKAVSGDLGKGLDEVGSGAAHPLVYDV